MVAQPPGLSTPPPSFVFKIWKKNQVVQHSSQKCFPAFPNQQTQFFRKLSQWRYHNTVFRDSDDLHPESKGSLHEFQGMAVICTWQLEHTEFSASPHKSSSAKQPSQHQGHSTSTCSALCRQSSSPHTAHWCEHINKFSLQVTHYLSRKWKTLKNSINLPGNICYILKPCWIKPGLWTYFRQKQENSQSLMMRRIQQCRSS